MLGAPFVSEMTYTVSSGTFKLYYTIPYRIVIGPVCGFVCVFVCVATITRIACIDLHQTGSVVEGSNPLQLIKFWPSCAPGRGPAVGRNLGPPNNFRTKRAIRFKFGTDTEDGASLRRDHKTTHKWAWPGSRHLIS